MCAIYDTRYRSVATASTNADSIANIVVEHLLLSLFKFVLSYLYDFEHLSNMLVVFRYAVVLVGGFYFHLVQTLRYVHQILPLSFVFKSSFRRFTATVAAIAVAVAVHVSCDTAPFLYMAITFLTRILRSPPLPPSLCWYLFSSFPIAQNAMMIYGCYV